MIWPKESEEVIDFAMNSLEKIGFVYVWKQKRVCIIKYLLPVTISLPQLKYSITHKRYYHFQSGDAAFSAEICFSLVRLRENYENTLVFRDACYIEHEDHEVLLIIRDYGKSLELTGTKRISKSSTDTLRKKKSTVESHTEWNQNFSNSIFVDLVNIISQLSKLYSLKLVSQIQCACYHCLSLGLEDECSKFGMLDCENILKEDSGTVFCHKFAPRPLNIRKLIPEISFCLVPKARLQVGELIGQGASSKVYKGIFSKESLKIKDCESRALIQIDENWSKCEEMNAITELGHASLALKLNELRDSTTNISSKFIIVGGLLPNGNKKIRTFDFENYTCSVIEFPKLNNRISPITFANLSHIFCLGGFESTDSEDSVSDAFHSISIISKENKTIKEKSIVGKQFPTERLHCSFIAKDNQVWVYGGINPKTGEVYNELLQLTLTFFNSEWKVQEELNPASPHLYGHTCILIKNKLVLFGGVLSKKFQDDDLAFNDDVFVIRHAPFNFDSFDRFPYLFITDSKI